MSVVKKYHWSVRTMHGLVGLLTIGMLCMGYWMIRMDSSSQKWQYYGLHKSFGVIVFLLLFIRISARAITDYPKSFYKVDSFNNIAEKLLYFIMYVTMFLMPFSGYLMSNAAGIQVVFFGILMPEITTRNIELAKIFHTTHVYTSYMLIALICIHILLIIYRTVAKKHNILQRMI